MVINLWEGVLIPKKGFHAITVKESTKRKLDELMKELRCKYYDEAIRKLISIYENKNKSLELQSGSGNIQNDTGTNGDRENGEHERSNQKINRILLHLENINKEDKE